MYKTCIKHKTASTHECFYCVKGYGIIKPSLKTKIYFKATRVYDWNIPIISWLADKVRDWAYNEELYY